MRYWELQLTCPWAVDCPTAACSGINQGSQWQPSVGREKFSWPVHGLWTVPLLPALVLTKGARVSHIWEERNPVDLSMGCGLSHCCLLWYQPRSPCQPPVGRENFNWPVYELWTVPLLPALVSTKEISAFESVDSTSSHIIENSPVKQSNCNMQVQGSVPQSKSS